MKVFLCLPHHSLRISKPFSTSGSLVSTDPWQHQGCNSGLQQQSRKCHHRHECEAVLKTAICMCPQILEEQGTHVWKTVWHEHCTYCGICPQHLQCAHDLYCKVPAMAALVSWLEEQWSMKIMKKAHDPISPLCPPPSMSSFLAATTPPCHASSMDIYLHRKTSTGTAVTHEKQCFIWQAYRSASNINNKSHCLSMYGMRAVCSHHIAKSTSHGKQASPQCVTCARSCLPAAALSG